MRSGDSSSSRSGSGTISGAEREDCRQMCMSGNVSCHKIYIAAVDCTVTECYAESPVCRGEDTQAVRTSALP